MSKWPARVVETSVEKTPTEVAVVTLRLLVVNAKEGLARGRASVPTNKAGVEVTVKRVTEFHVEATRVAWQKNV